MKPEMFSPNFVDEMELASAVNTLFLPASWMSTRRIPKKAQNGIRVFKDESQIERRRMVSNELNMHAKVSCSLGDSGGDSIHE
jgi:hypothetical protein